MGSMAIVWRNPNRVHHRLRWIQQKQPEGRSIYIVQQLISRERDTWVNTTVLELTHAPAQPASQPAHRWRFGFGA